jgi:hypothetical protein
MNVEPANEKKFEIHKLEINMRLEMLNIAISAKVDAYDLELQDITLTDIERQRLTILRDECNADYSKQVAYAKMLLQIGNGEVSFDQEEDPNIELSWLDEKEHSSDLILSAITTFTQVDVETVTEDYLVEQRPDLLTLEDVNLLAECNKHPDTAKSIKRKKDLFDLKFKQLAGESKRAALAHLYPTGFDVTKMEKRTILGITNTQVIFIFTRFNNT